MYIIPLNEQIASIPTKKFSLAGMTLFSSMEHPSPRAKLKEAWTPFSGGLCTYVLVMKVREEKSYDLREILKRNLMTQIQK